MRCPTPRILVVVLALSAGACTSGTSPSTTTSYTGTFTGQMIVSTTTGASVCLSTRTLNGTLKITLQQPKSSGSVTGTADTTGTLVEIAVIPTSTCSPLTGSVSLNGSRAVTGTTTTFGFTSSSTATVPTPNGAGSVTCTDTTAFTGSLAGSAVTGTLTYTSSCQGNNGISTITGNGTTAIPVALR